MIRGLIVLAIILIAMQVIRTLVRTAVKTYHADAQARSRRSRGDDMVLDPECGTYVVKDRALARTLRGERVYFCSEECARRHQERGAS